MKADLQAELFGPVRFSPRFLGQATRGYSDDSLVKNTVFADDPPRRAPRIVRSQ